MKKILIQLLSVLIFISCKKEQISVEGYLVDERNGSHFNPFSDAIVRLYGDIGSYGNSEELGSCSVDQNGYFKITAKHEKTGFQARLQLTSEENWPKYSDATITVGSNTYKDFTIRCRFQLNRVFINQTSTNFDSIVVNITNSKEARKYIYLLNPSFKLLNIPELLGDEKNYLVSYIYASSLFATRYDTIFGTCRTTINDTIKY